MQCNDFYEALLCDVSLVGRVSYFAVSLSVCVCLSVSR